MKIKLDTAKKRFKLYLGLNILMRKTTEHLIKR